MGQGEITSGHWDISPAEPRIPKGRVAEGLDCAIRTSNFSGRPRTDTGIRAGELQYGDQVRVVVRPPEGENLPAGVPLVNGSTVVGCESPMRSGLIELALNANNQPRRDGRWGRAIVTGSGAGSSRRPPNA